MISPIGVLWRQPPRPKIKRFLCVDWATGANKVVDTEAFNVLGYVEILNTDFINLSRTKRVYFIS